MIQSSPTLAAYLLNLAEHLDFAFTNAAFIYITPRMYEEYVMVIFSKLGSFCQMTVTQ